MANSAAAQTWTMDYLRLRYRKGGRQRPAVDCYGLYRVIVGERTGIWIEEGQDVMSATAIRRAMVRARRSAGWREIAAVKDGALVFAEPERELDLVLMHGVVGRGRHAVAVPFHCGCVVKAGWMIDIEETNDVLIRPFRDVGNVRAHPTVRHRVLGIYRPEALA